MVDTLKMASELGFGHLTIESYCLVVINKLSTGNMVFNVYGRTVEEAFFVRLFSFISFCYPYCLADWCLDENIYTRFDLDYSDIIH